MLEYVNNYSNIIIKNSFPLIANKYACAQMNVTSLSYFGGHVPVCLMESFLCKHKPCSDITFHACAKCVFLSECSTGLVTWNHSDGMNIWAMHLHKEYTGALLPWESVGKVCHQFEISKVGSNPKEEHILPWLTQRIKSWVCREVALWTLALNKNNKLEAV